MSILNKLSDVLKEVFWIKTSSKTTRRLKPAKKKIVKKPIKKPVAKAKPVSKVKPPKIKVVSIPQKKTLKPVKVSKVAKAPETKTPAPKSKKFQLDPGLVQIGEITHYFDRIKVCVVKITHGTILIGDKLTIVGQKNKFVQKVWSMQVESEDVKVAKKGQLIGLKVDKAVSIGDVVYK